MCDWLLFCLDMGAGRLGRAEAVAACSGEAMLDSAMPLHLCWYSTCQTCAALRCAGLGWAGLGRVLLSLHAARELFVVGGCRVRTSDLLALLWAIQWPPMDFNCVC